MIMQNRQFTEMFINIFWGKMIINFKSETQCVNKQVSPASEAKNLELRR